MKVILFFPYAATYRQAIYKLIDDSFDCEFHFCKHTHHKLKTLDYSIFKKCKLDLVEHVLHKGWVYYGGLKNIKLGNGKNLIMPGNIRDLGVWMLLLTAKFFYPQTQTILWTHGAYGRESRLQYFLKRIFYSLCDKILLYGDYAKNIMIEKKIANANKISIIYNSLDYDSQKLYRNKECSNPFSQHFQNENKNILFIGRLTNEKRLDLLIQAISKLSTEHQENYNLIFIGNGEAKTNLEEEAQQLSVAKNVWFYGACFDDEEMHPLLQHADLCVSPGNVGLTAIHALTYGVPVISHNNFAYQGPEFEAIQEGISGSFFKENDLESLIKCISNWFWNPNTKNRNKVRENCYKIVDELYNPHNQIEVLKGILK